MVEEAAKTGALDPRAGELAARAIDFRELSVASVMVPRVRVVSISREASAEQLQQALCRNMSTPASRSARARPTTSSAMSRLRI